MKKKRIGMLSLLLCALTAVLCFAACSKDPGSDNSGSQSSKTVRISVVTTIFPEYDWTRQILGESTDDIDLKLLIGSGVDLHSYQPSVDDIMLISSCDVFVYVGGESDRWVTEALSQAQNKNMKVVKLIDVIGSAAKTEEAVEGMQEHDHDDNDSGSEHEESEYDEHIWLSVNNAALCCDAITDALSKAIPDKADTFRSNSESYKKQLSALDADYRAAVSEKGNADTIVVGDRFPFRYLVDDYNIKYFAAFSGCSAETEASFETIVFLAGKVDELKLGVIIQTESSDGSVAKTIRSNTKTADQNILTLDSMQSVTQENIQNGTTYLSFMKSNLAVLKEALGSVKS